MSSERTQQPPSTGSYHEKWYAMRHLPAGRCRVRVRWEGREFIAARMLHPETRHLTWCAPPESPGASIAWLPPKIDRRRRDAGHAWSPEPDCWQPEDAAAWTWPKVDGRIEIPPELPRMQPRMYSGDGRRRWASMTEQAERSARAQVRIAAEIEAEFGPDAPPPEAMRIGSRWWREPALVRYSPEGAVSRAEVEGRVCRALLTDGIRPGELPQGWQGVGTALGQMVHETITSEETAVDLRTFEPTRADLADQERFLPMKWFAALNPPLLRRRRAPAWELNAAQVVVVLHALGFSWRQAGRHQRLGVSAQRAHELYHGGKANTGAIEKLWRIANGMPMLPGMPAMEDPVAALRRRNREARRRERGGVA